MPVKNRRRYVWSGCLLVAASLGAAHLARANQPPPPVPDTQKLLMENALVRVFEIRVPPGTFEAKHSHARGLTIALSDYDTESRTFPDGKPTRGHTAFSEVRWVESVVHEVRNVGSTEQHVIRIELK
jgi:hypothetical protein